MTTNNGFQEFYDDLDLRDLAPITRRSYTASLEQYRHWLDGSKPDERTLKRYLAHLRQAGKKPSSVSVWYNHLRQFHEFLGHPVKKWHIRIKVPQDLPPFIHAEEIQLILGRITPEVTPDTVTRLRDRAIIHTFALTGMRLAELCGLKVKDVDFAAAYIRTVGKGDKTRMIPFGDELAAVLTEYLAAANLKPTDSLFGCGLSTVKRLVRKYADLAGMTHIHAHSFRHFYATQLAHKREPPRVAQELLGHADLSTTMIYQQVAPEGLRSAAEKVTINGDKAAAKADAIAERLNVSPDLVKTIIELLKGVSDES